MVLIKAVRRIFFTDDQENKDALHPQANEQRPRTRSSSLVRRWWRDKSSSREGLRISRPFDPFPVLAPAAEDFDFKITSTSLSEILLWYVYYDVVQVPGRNSEWFRDLPGESMIGWIGLGMELKRTNNFPSKKLKLTCEELAIDAGGVVARLVRLSSRTSMLHSELDTRTTYAIQFEKLTSDLKLVECLRPVPRTQAERWKMDIEECIRDYMQVVYLKVVNINQFDLDPATTMGETRRRNDVRRRLEQVRNAPRDPPPKNVYVQAQEMLGRNCVTFLTSQEISSKSVRASSDGYLRGDAPNGSERGRFRSRGTQLDQSNTRRRSAPDLNELELVLERMSAQCSQFAKELRRIRVQQDQAFRAQRVDSLDPGPIPTILQPNPAINNHSDYPISDGIGTRPFNRPLDLQYSKKRLSKSPELGRRRPPYDANDATRNAASISHETCPNRFVKSSSEWLRNQNEDDIRTYHAYEGRACHSDKFSSHPMVHQRPPHRRNSVDFEPTREFPRQQQDVRGDFDKGTYLQHGQASNSRQHHSSRSPSRSLTGGPSFVTNPWPKQDAIAGTSLNDDLNRPTTASPTLTHEPSLFMTPPSSPTTSMLNTPWWRIPGAWPPGSEAGSSRLGSSLRAMSPSTSTFDSVQGPSRATMAGFSDITEPDEMVEAIRFQTRRAMASMVDLNSLSSRSSRS